MHSNAWLLAYAPKAAAAAATCLDTAAACSIAGGWQLQQQHQQRPPLLLHRGMAPACRTCCCGWSTMVSDNRSTVCTSSTQRQQQLPASRVDGPSGSMRPDNTTRLYYRAMFWQHPTAQPSSSSALLPASRGMLRLSHVSVPHSWAHYMG
jgi:hypothetical protein